MRYRSIIAGGLPIAHLGSSMINSIPNLVSFGCSIPYGHGLPDCHIHPNFPGPKASTLAWPNLLSDMLNMNCINLSQPGNSNFSIILEMLKFKFTSSDVCIIMWTYPDRDLIIHENGMEKIGVWVDEKRFASWLKVNPDKTIQLRFWSWVTLASAWLYSNGIKHHFLLTKFGLYGNPPDWARHIKFLSPDMGIIRKKYPLALDNHHPGIDAHRFFAKEVFKEIT